MSIKLSSSLICTDLCNLERSIHEISELDIDLLHIDLIDGYFSPSMPIGLGMVRALRKKTDIPFDVHLMVKENDFFIDEIIDIGVRQVCFHCESEIHIDRLLNKIKKSGIGAGIALIPSTPISVLEYVIEKCDFVMLMLINPGYAGDRGEEQVPYALKKVNDCYKYIKHRGLDIPIEIDGRITIKRIPHFVSAGADILVLGSKSLFNQNSNLIENIKKIKSAVNIGLDRRSKNEIS